MIRLDERIEKRHAGTIRTICARVPADRVEDFIVACNIAFLAGRMSANQEHVASALKDLAIHRARSGVKT